ncbi:MAG: hypothetical protein D6696_10820 [Acidobacteria bacterium]|nr:MAG: hypothetical protein D6696_10820 [Acidobacteriota bacterium]
MYRRSALLIPACILLTAALAGCVDGSPSEDRNPIPADRAGGFAPQPGQEEDFFRAVKVFIHVDLDERSIRVEPDPNDDNVVHGIERIFYPPTGSGETYAVAHGCRPEKPARQVRWVVLCKSSNGQCRSGEHAVVIRPKATAEKLGHCEEAGVNIDYTPPECPWRDECCTTGLEPEPPAALRDPKTAGAYPEELQSYEALLHDLKAKQRGHDDLQAETIFNPESRGVFYIPLSTCTDPQKDGGCCAGTADSGIPNVPEFYRGGRSFGWHYTVELWKGGEVLACLDPPVWVEDDGSPGG